MKKKENSSQSKMKSEITLTIFKNKTSLVSTVKILVFLYNR